MDNDYPQNLLNSIWTTIRESLSNIKLAAREREKLRPVLSVKVVNSSTQTESESFEVGHPQTSHPHCKGSEFTRTLKLFDKGPDQSSNLNSYEEAAVRGTSIRILNEASQSRRSGKNFKTKGKTVVVERDEPVEGSIIETPYAICDIDIQNAMTGASQPFRFQTKKTLCQQEETMFIENEGDTSQQLPRISPPLFDNGTEQDEQVLKIQKCAKNNYSYEEISTAAASKRTPECLKQIISWDELEELPINCDEPQSLTSQLRSEVIFGDEGYTVPSDKGDNLVEVSPDEDVEYTVTTASKRLKKSKIPCTEENIRKHFGRSLNDAAESFGYSVSTFKRRCRNVGITWWQSGKSQMTDCKSGATKFSLDASGLPNRHVVSHSNKDCNMMTVKVTYDAGTIRFELPSSSGLEELENSVIKRLQWDRKSFSIKYQDDEDDWIDISCDEDV